MKDPNSGQTSGYHFFLTISEPLISELNRTITELAEKMHSSAFVAHCTLIAEIPDAPGLSEEMILEQAKRLAATTRPLTLTLDTVEIEDTRPSTVSTTREPALWYVFDRREKTGEHDARLTSWPYIRGGVAPGF
jgi:hypothetical protein